MDIGFHPKDADQRVVYHYRSGKQKEVCYFRNGNPANGWSRKLFYEDSSIQQAECYSNSLLIEQIAYDEHGKVISHKIYSHAKQQLVDKPKTSNVVRHNTVSGVAHMGFYYRHLPAISQFIKAEYDEKSLDKAYDDFLNEADKESFDFDKEYSWRLKGERMSFIIGFEKYEGYYQWSLATSNEDDYEAAKVFMDNLKNTDSQALNE